MKRSNIPNFGPLSGVRVLVSGTNVAGPFSASLMADFGADVIFLDSPAVPDNVRTTDTKALVNKERRNSRSLVLNFFTKEGKEILFKLLKDTDILVEASKAGTWASKGLSDEVLWEVNPKLVIAHVSGYGQHGDDRYLRRGSYDSIGQAMSGYANINGTTEVACTAPAFLGDYTTALLTAYSCMAALHNAEKTGKGDSIDIAQFEALLMISGGYEMDAFNYNVQRKRGGRNHPTVAGWGQFDCKDGVIFIQCLGLPNIMKMYKFLGAEDKMHLLEGKTFFVEKNTPAGDVLEDGLKAWCADKTVIEADQILNDMGLAAGGFLTYDMMLDHPHFVARETFMDFPAIEGGTVKGLNITPRMKNNPGKVWRAAPHYGEDNADILEELGYSAEDVQTFYEKKLLNKNDNI